MKKINETLELENVKNLEIIQILKKRNLVLENEKKSSISVKESQNEGTQTELERPIFCYECDFPAEDYHDLGEHVTESHAERFCQVCNARFESNDSLTEHVSSKHAEVGNTDEDKTERFHCNKPYSENFTCNF